MVTNKQIQEPLHWEFHRTGTPNVMVLGQLLWTVNN